MNNGVLEEIQSRPFLDIDGLERLVSRLKAVKHTMRFYVVNVTPVAAAELLRHNHPKNRKPKDGKINQFLADMMGDYWRLTHQAIAISDTGWLIDGQNRLEAVVLSEQTVPFLVVVGVPEDAFLGTDYGASRNVMDMAKVQDEKISPDWPGIARRMILSTKGQDRAITPQEVMSFIHGHRPAITWACENLPQHTGITQAPVRAVIARAYYLKEAHERIQDFCRVLLTGLPDNPKADLGALRLRNWLLDNFTHGAKRKQKMSFRPTIVYGKTENALIKFLAREPVEFLHETSQEMFPLP